MKSQFLLKKFNWSLCSALGSVKVVMLHWLLSKNVFGVKRSDLTNMYYKNEYTWQRHSFNVDYFLEKEDLKMMHLFLFALSLIGYCNGMYVSFHVSEQACTHACLKGQYIFSNIKLFHWLINGYEARQKFKCKCFDYLFVLLNHHYHNIYYDK